jgi:hypothetical protein
LGFSQFFSQIHSAWFLSFSRSTFLQGNSFYVIVTSSDWNSNLDELDF